MSVPTQLQLIHKCREAAAEVSQRLLQETEGDIDLAQLEALRRHLESAKRILEKSKSGQEQSTDVSENTEDTFDCQKISKRRLRKDQKMVNTQ